MKEEFQKYLDFHRTKGGTGKMFNYKFLDYSNGFLKLEGEFTEQTLNPNRFVQGGQMTSMLDDVTSLLLIYESKGTTYPNSINLHSHHHRPLGIGKVITTAELVKKGKTIATVKGEIYNQEGKLATTLMHTVFLIKTDFKIKKSYLTSTPSLLFYLVSLFQLYYFQCIGKTKVEKNLKIKKRIVT